MSRPSFLITIDTEGDRVWMRPQPIETKNSAFLPRFQALCEKYSLKPTYLTNYEMALCPTFQAFGRDVLARKTGEIGMHLHAWHSPPAYELTEDDHRHHPYLIEYPWEVMRSKVAYMTDLLETTFGTKMLSHRAGRWSFDARYAGLLLEHGYRVDCSVTPYVSWQWKRGDPRRSGGTDFSRFPTEAYFVDHANIDRPGDSALLEVPMTIVPVRPVLRRLAHTMLPSSALVASTVNRLLPARWLRPNGRNLPDLRRIVDCAAAEKRPYIEFMLHSSELMAGGSPTFQTESSIEILYDQLEQLFVHANRSFQGATLSEFHDDFRTGHIDASCSRLA